MNEIVRLYRCRRMLGNKSVASVSKLIVILDISSSTLMREIAKVRDKLHVPTVFNHQFDGSGISKVPPQSWPTLRFLTILARWVLGERRHATQEKKTEADGSYVLLFTYSGHPRSLATSCAAKQRGEGIFGGGVSVRMKRRPYEPECLFENLSVFT